MPKIRVFENAALIPKIAGSAPPRPNSPRRGEASGGVDRERAAK
jgi:hypothetical protein